MEGDLSEGNSQEEVSASQTGGSDSDAREGKSIRRQAFFSIRFASFLKKRGGRSGGGYCRA